MNNICYIIGACRTEAPIQINKNDGDMVICADGGYNLIENKSQIDILLGDFDSIQNLPKCSNIIKYPIEKDDTDLFIAYKTAQNHGYTKYVIYGGIGGRIDHTFANMQMLVSMAKRRHQAFFIGDGVIITAIHNSSIVLSARKEGIISVFSMGECADGVNIEGLKYSVKDGKLTNDFPLGVSNEFIGNKAKISVQQGTLMIVWYENNIDLDELLNVC